MADYKITFKAEGMKGGMMKGGMSKQAAGMRQQAIQASKAAAQTDTSAPMQNKELITTLQKLIASNKELAKAMGSAGHAGRGGGLGGAMGGAVLGAIGSLGSIGAALPYIGAGIATAGFVISKAKEIAHAYMTTTSQQLGTVGTAGFRYGKDIFSAGEMGKGIAAYSMETGKFSDMQESTGTQHYGAFNSWARGKMGLPTTFEGSKFSIDPNEQALQMAAIHGVSPSETLKQAGILEVAGGNYSSATQQIAGAGIQTESQMMMAGIADLMKEAITDGIDTSQMAKDTSKQLILLTKRSPHQSVEAALKMVNQFKDVQNATGEGQITSMMGLATWQVGQEQMLGKMTGPDSESYLNNLVKHGVIDKNQAEKLKGLKPGATYEDIGQATDASTAMALIKNEIKTSGRANIEYSSLRRLIGEPEKGEGEAEHFNKAIASGLLSGTGMDEVTARNIYRSHDKEYTAQLGTEEEGKRTLGARAAGVFSGKSGKQAKTEVGKETNLLETGEKVTNVVNTIDLKLNQLATGGLDAANTAVDTIGDGINKLAGIAKEFGTAMDEIKTKGFKTFLISLLMGK